jgi:hypothetical protein
VLTQRHARGGDLFAAAAHHVRSRRNPRRLGGRSKKRTLFADRLNQRNFDRRPCHRQRYAWQAGTAAQVGPGDGPAGRPLRYASRGGRLGAAQLIDDIQQRQGVAKQFLHDRIAVTHGGHIGQSPADEQVDVTVKCGYLRQREREALSQDGQVNRIAQEKKSDR